MFGQVIVNSLTLAATYVLMAVGLTLVLGSARLINWPHGSLYMLGTYVVYYVFEKAGINYILSIVAAIVTIGALGMLIERGVLRPLINRPLIPVLAASLGVMILLDGLAVVVFGPEDKSIESTFTGVIKVGGISLAVERLAVVFIAAILMLGLYYFIQRTKQGKAIRAVAQDRVTATLQGINIFRIRLLAMGVGCGLAGAAGAITGPIFYVSPFIGELALVKALIVMIIGGLGSIPGAIVGGLILGVLEGFGFTYIGQVTEMLGFVLLILILLVRPQGLFGEVYELGE